MDEPFNNHVNQRQMRVFGLDYMFGNLEVSRDWFEAEDDVYCSELAVSVKVDLEPQHLVRQGEVHQNLSFGGSLFVLKTKNEAKIRREANIGK